MVTVNNTSELASELSSSAGGKDIVLAEGVDFGPISIANTVYASPNVIRSANPANRSTINRFTTQNNGNLQFEDVAFIITDTSQADNYKHNSFYNTDDLSFTRCLFQMTQSGGLLNKGTGLGIEKGSRIDVVQCEFKNLHGGVTFLDNDFITIRDSNFHTIRTDCINVNDSNDITIEDNWLHDSADRVALDHVDMIQIARGTIRSQSLRIVILRNVIDQGPSGNYGQTIHFGLDGKAKDASTLHDDILIEDNYVHMGHSNAISFDWVDNCIIRNNSFLSAPPADIFSEPALKILSSASNTVTIERNIFCQNQTTFGGGWTHSDNFYLPESTYGTNFTELSRTTTASYNDHEIKAGTAHHTALAGSRMQPREGGWGGNGIVPRAATLWGYQGGFQATSGTTGTISAQETGQDALVATGVSSVSGAMTAQEIGQDVLVAAGTVDQGLQTLPRTVTFSVDTMADVTGAMSVQETGQDTLAATGVTAPSTIQTLPLTVTFSVSTLADVTGTVSVQETGSDAASASGAVSISGSASVQETGSDVFAGAGTITAPDVTGTMAAQESGADSMVATGGPSVAGTVAAQEAGTDSPAGVGAVAIAGALSAAEVGTDDFSASGTASISGTVAAQETGSDAFSGTGSSVVTGTASAQETGSDTFSGTGSVSPSGIAGVMAAQETGSDVFDASGTLGAQPITGTLAAQETGSDVFDASGTVIGVGIVGTLAAQETGSDDFSANGTLIVVGDAIIQESGADVFAGTGTVALIDVTGTLAAQEIGSDTFRASAPPLTSAIGPNSSTLAGGTHDPSTLVGGTHESIFADDTQG